MRHGWMNTTQYRIVLLCMKSIKENMNLPYSLQEIFLRMKVSDDDLQTAIQELSKDEKKNRNELFVLHQLLFLKSEKRRQQMIKEGFKKEKIFNTSVDVCHEI